MALSKYDIDPGLVAATPGTSHALMLELVGSNKRVLDVGCDTGYLGRVLMTMGDSVSGVEMNPIAAEEAARYLERVVVEDLETVDLVDEFGPATFDAVVFGDVLEHLRDPLPVLRQSRRLLTPGGSVVISVPNIAHGDVRLSLLSGRFDYSDVGLLDSTHLRFFTRDSLVAFLRDAGFVLADLRRSVAPLFTTELGVQEQNFDAELVATLRTDVEATTYQFIARAVPDDVTSLESVQALRMDELRMQIAEATAELERTRVQLAAGRDECADLTTRLAASTQRVGEVQAAHDHAVAQRDGALARIEVMRPSLLGLIRRGVRRVVRGRGPS